MHDWGSEDYNVLDALMDNAGAFYSWFGKVELNENSTTLTIEVADDYRYALLPDQREHPHPAAEPDAADLGERPRDVAQAHAHGDMTRIRRGFGVVARSHGLITAGLRHPAIVVRLTAASSRARRKGQD